MGYDRTQQEGTKAAAQGLAAGLLSPLSRRVWAGYFSAPAALQCPLGRITCPLLLPSVTLVFCSLEGYDAMKVRLPAPVAGTTPPDNLQMPAGLFRCSGLAPPPSFPLQPPSLLRGLQLDQLCMVGTMLTGKPGIPAPADPSHTCCAGSRREGC